MTRGYMVCSMCCQVYCIYFCCRWLTSVMRGEPSPQPPVSTWRSGWTKSFDQPLVWMYLSETGEHWWYVWMYLSETGESWRHVWMYLPETGECQWYVWIYLIKTGGHYGICGCTWPLMACVDVPVWNWRTLMVCVDVLAWNWRMLMAWVDVPVWNWRHPMMWVDVPVRNWRPLLVWVDVPVWKWRPLMVWVDVPVRKWRPLMACVDVPVWNWRPPRLEASYVFDCAACGCTCLKLEASDSVCGYTCPKLEASCMFNCAVCVPAWNKASNGFDCAVYVNAPAWTWRSDMSASTILWILNHKATVSSLRLELCSF